MIEFLIVFGTVMLALVGHILLGLLVVCGGIVLVIILNYFTGIVTKIINYLCDLFE